MADIELKITGAAELQRALEELPLKASRKIVRESAKAAVQPWAEGMRQRVRRGPHHTSKFDRSKGAIKKNKAAAPGTVVSDVIASNIVTNATVHSDLSASVRVGPARFAGGFFLLWAVWLELTGRRAGISEHGRHYAAMPAYPFIRPTFEAEKTAVLDRFISGIRDALASVGLRTS